MKSNLSAKTRTIITSAGFICGSFFIYFFAAYFGSNLSLFNAPGASVWATSGLAVSLVYLLGVPAAIGIFSAVVLSCVQSGMPAAATLLFALSATLQAVTAVAVFKHLQKSKFGFGVYSIPLYAALSLAFVSTIGAAIGTLALLNNHFILQDQIFSTWTTWWSGDLLSGLFITPFAYQWTQLKAKPLNTTKNRWVMTVSLVGFACTLNYFVFTSAYGSPYLFLVFLPLLFATICFESSLLIYVLSFLTLCWALTATALGHGPFFGPIPQESLNHLQLFLLGFGLTSLGLGGLQGPLFQHRIIAALVSGWVISGLVFFAFFNSAVNVDQSHFHSKAEQAQLYLEMQLNDYATLLQSSVGFFNATDQVTQNEWNIFSTKLLLNRDFQKVEGIGIIFPSPSQDINDFYKYNNIKKPIAHFEIHDPYGTPADQKEENPEIHLIASYIEPFDLNQRAVGIDIAMEKKRYQAALQARDTGLPSITDNIILFQNKVAGSAGFIIFIPFYKKGYPVLSEAQRKKAFAGLVFSPVIANKFFADITQKFTQDLNLEIYLSKDTSLKNKIFTSELSSSDPEIQIVKSTQLLGKQLTFIWRKSQKFEHTSGLFFSVVSFFGALLTLFLAMTLSSLQNITLKAQALADEKTKEVVEKNIIWKKLTETAPVGIYLTDKDGCCTYVNQNWSELTGLSLEQAQGVGWIQALHPEDFNLVMSHWKNLMANGQFSCQYRFYNSKKEIIYISGRAVALKNSDNKITGYLGIAQDITDSHKKGTALIAASRLSSLGEMASGIAHEINNPLSIILGKSTLLQTLVSSEKYDPLKVKHFAAQISETVDRISKIIKGLRSFARETSGVSFEKYSIDEVLNDTLDFCQERFLSHHIDFIVPDSIDKNLYFWGRSEQITQVLLNILNNAFDATVDSKIKWVRLEFEVIDKKIRIKISNSGALIKAADSVKIFEPFYTTKDIGKGTGLGLSISKGIIDTHSGNLYVDLNEAHTTFVIELNLYFSDKNQFQLHEASPV